MPSPKLSSRRLALLSGFALFGVLGAASVCSAESPWRRRVYPSAPPPFRITLEDASGAPLPTFHHAGTTFVLGEPGDRYNVRVYNPTSERIEAVVSVDGRDAISGEVGGYVTQRGYLIEPWGSVLVEGFRRSLEEVAAFRFTGRGGSYSALRGTPQHVGVIGVAVFPEKLRPPAPVALAPRRRYYPRDYERAPEPSSPRWHGRGADSSGGATEKKSAPTRAPEEPARPRAESSDKDADDSPRKGRAPSGRASGPSNIGTEYGENQNSNVVEVAFERRSPTHPSAVLSLRYDDYDGLEARGVDLSSLGYAYRDEPEPEAFPYSRSRFAPPPR